MHDPSDHSKQDDPAVSGFRSTSDILAAVGQASYSWDIPDDCLAWSDNFFELIGFEEGVDVSSGREFEKLLSTDSPETRFGVILGRPLDDVPSAGIPYQCIYAINADQVRSEFSVWLEDTGRWYPDENGKPLRAEGVVRIINERRMREEKLERKSNYDDLTGLPNRRFLEEQINRISETGLVANSSAAFMMLSICDFDRVNNTYGFSAGDEVLKKIAENLGEMLRGEDILARFSGAKLGIILKDCSNIEVFPAAQRILNAIQGTLLHTSKGPVAIRAAIGACLLPRHARRATDAISASLDALRHARVERGLRAYVHDPDPLVVEQRKSDARMVSRFVEALDAGALHLAFQPVVSSSSHRPAFYEALLRLDSMGVEDVGNASFIKMAEDLGLMRVVDNKSLLLAMDVLEQYGDARISLNITHETTEDSQWLSTLASRLSDIAGGAERLIVEITESQIPADIEETAKFVQLVHDIGCKVAIDDFGAGYTSFANLKNLNVDLVKVDGSFCRDLKQDPRNGIFLQTLQNLASAFEVQTVVEWVEDAETAALMKEWGFDYLQGNCFGMPLAVAPWDRNPVVSDDEDTAEKLSA